MKHYTDFQIEHILECCSRSEVEAVARQLLTQRNNARNENADLKTVIQGHELTIAGLRKKVS